MTKQDKRKTKLTQWHPAFCSAIELTFMEDADKLSFVREKTLNTKPLEIDLLVIKKVKDAPLKNNIGKLFLGYNILEYKSPGDKMTMDTFFKVIAYSCLYKVYDTATIPDSVGDITATLVRMEKPVKFMEILQNYEFVLENPWPGIYYIKGDTFNIPVQIVVTQELDEADNVWLKAIQNNLSDKTAEKLVELWNSATSSQEKLLIDSVMQVSVVENPQAYDIIKEGNTMCQAMLDLMKPEIDQIVEKAVEQNSIEHIENLVNWLIFHDPSLSKEEALESAKMMLCFKIV